MKISDILIRKKLFSSAVLGFGQLHPVCRKSAVVTEQRCQGPKRFNFSVRGDQCSGEIHVHR